MTPIGRGCTPRPPLTPSNITLDPPLATGKAKVVLFPLEKSECESLLPSKADCSSESSKLINLQKRKLCCAFLVRCTVLVNASLGA